MTDQELLDLYHKRQDALAQIGGFGHKPIRDMPPSMRSRCNAVSIEFRERDQAITTELRLRGQSAHLDGVTLHLTSDRLHWVALQPGTQRPLLYEDSPYMQTPTKGTLYRYPKEALRRP